MNPHQKNKIDINVRSIFRFTPHEINLLTLTQSLSPDEQRLFRLYGKLPTKTDHLAKHLKERKYFDSGDYALSKSGAASSVDTGSVGTEHPLPENIPHLSSPSMTGAASQGGSGNGNHHMGMGGITGAQSGSPVKESSYLNRQSSIDDVEDSKVEQQKKKNGSVSPPPAKEGIPIPPK